MQVTGGLTTAPMYRAGWVKNSNEDFVFWSSSLSLATSFLMPRLPECGSIMDKPGRQPGESRPAVVWGRHQPWSHYGERSGTHRGLCTGHASTGAARELGRANASLCEESGRRRPDRETKWPGVGREDIPPPDEPETGHEQGKQQGTGERERERSELGWVVGSLS